MIRQTQPDELGKLALCAAEFHAASRILGDFSLPRFEDLWRALLGNGAGVIFVDDRDGEFVGCIGGFIHRDIYAEDFIAEEMFWFVREEHRGAGVGLYVALERWARAKGAAALQMVHLADSMPERLSKFYRRQGFELIETRYGKRLA